MRIRRGGGTQGSRGRRVRKVIAPFENGKAGAGGQGGRSGDSAAPPATEPPEALLAMSLVGDVVTAGVVAEDPQRLVPIQPLRLQSHDDQALDLRKGEGWSFF